MRTTHALLDSFRLADPLCVSPASLVPSESISWVLCCGHSVGARSVPPHTPHPGQYSAWPSWAQGAGVICAETSQRGRESGYRTVLC